MTRYALITLLILFISTACRMVAAEPAPTPSPTVRLNLDLVTHRLERLRSYRASLVAEFSGQKNGQPVSGRVDRLIEQQQADNAYRYSVNLQTVPAFESLPTGVGEFIRAGQQVYAKPAQAENWLTFQDRTMQPSNLDLLDVADWLVIPSQLSGAPVRETRYGAGVQRYDFGDGALVSQNITFTNTQGMLWISEAEQIVVQYELSTTLKVIIPNESDTVLDEGHLRLSYRLNESFEIARPWAELAAHPLLTDFPQPAQSELLTVLPNLLTYRTPLTPTETARFYQDFLLEQAWQERQLEIFAEKAKLHYHQDQRNIEILVTQTLSHSNVTLTLNDLSVVKE